MKKIFSIFLALFMLISIFSVSVYAETKVKLSLTNETVYAGEEFKLNLFISDNSKMSGAVIDINYDKIMLEFVSAKQGAILDSNANISIKNIDGEKSKVRFTYLAPNSSVTSEGVIMTITFKALENATGNTDVTISIPNAADFVTQDLQNIPYEVSNSVVKIINTTYEDTNGVSSTTDNTAVPTDDYTQSTTEQQDDKINSHNGEDNNDNGIIIVLLVVGLGFIAFGVVMIVQSKKKKE